MPEITKPFGLIHLYKSAWKSINHIWITKNPNIYVDLRQKEFCFQIIVYNYTENTKAYKNNYILLSNILLIPTIKLQLKINIKSAREE